ncbi:MAG: alanine racemase [Actinomycetota bacterium]
MQRDALRSNFDRVSEAAGVPVCAVIKANGYGHGLVESALAFLEAGAAMLAVSRVAEAELLRNAGVTGDILLLVPPSDPAAAVANGCEFMWDDVMRPLPPGSRVHLKVDVGMGRFGVTPRDAVDAALRLRESGSLVGLATHFPDAASSVTGAQLRGFTEVVAAVRAALEEYGGDASRGGGAERAEGALGLRVHAANSAALLAHPGSRFDMVRVGTLLYGQDPPGVRAPWNAPETFAWYARVASVRELPAGSSVGYGREWLAEKPTRIATLPIGWADGFSTEPAPRSPSRRETLARIKRAVSAHRKDPRHVIFTAAPDGADLQIADPRAQVIGRVSMQTTTVAVSDPNIVVGSVARIPARRLMVLPAIPRIWV